MPTSPARRTLDIDISFKPRVADQSSLRAPERSGAHRASTRPGQEGLSAAIKQDSPLLYGGEREHPRLDPGVIREPLPGDVLVRRVDDDQDLALTLERSAEHDEPESTRPSTKRA